MTLEFVPKSEGKQLFQVFFDWVVDKLPQKEKTELLIHIHDTPNRVVDMFVDEFLSGYAMDPQSILKTTFSDSYDEIVLVRNISFYSLCAHHLLPFYGKAHVAYLPDGKVVGLSKLARLVECFARRLQIQERLTSQIASALIEFLSPKAAACIIEAEHLCVGCRGVEKQGTETVTSVLLGQFRDQPETRAELFSLIRRGGRNE